MGKPNFERDIAGVKLFGRCKKYGSCICGRCADAPANRLEPVTIRSADGEEREELAPPVNAAEYQEDAASEASGWGAKDKPGRTHALANAKRCQACNLVLRSNHKCKGAGAGPVTVRLPGAEPALPRPTPVVWEEETITVPPQVPVFVTPKPAAPEPDQPETIERIDGACRNGHIRTPDNTHIRPDRSKECIDCRRERNGNTPRVVKPRPEGTQQKDHRVVIELGSVRITIEPIINKEPK